MDLTKPGIYQYIIDTPYIASRYAWHVHDIIPALSPIYIDWRVIRDPQLSIEDEIFNSSVIEAMEEDLEWSDILAAIEIMHDVIESLPGLVETLEVCQHSPLAHIAIDGIYTYIEIYVEEATSANYLCS